MIQGTSFFERSLASIDKKTAESGSKLIPIGGEVFHALAVAFLDTWKSISYAQAPAVQIIYKQFQIYFPNYISPYQAPLTKPVERMRMLMNSARRSEVVDCLAYILRQILINEVYAHPLNYREIFDGLDANTSKNYLRQPDTKLANTVLRALVIALDVTLVLLFLEPGKELRKRVVYETKTNSSPKMELTLQVQDDNYFPKVKYPSDFAYVGQLATKSHPPAQVHQQTETIAEYLTVINEDNQRLLSLYKQWRHNLLTMTQAGELTRLVLIALFIKFLPSETGTITDPEKFFFKLSKESSMPLAFNRSDKTTMLIMALASWISVGLIDPDTLSDNINPSSTINGKCS